MPVGAAAELACFPSTEEVRMVRSIALLALMEAVRTAGGVLPSTDFAFRPSGKARHGVSLPSPRSVYR